MSSTTARFQHFDHTYEFEFPDAQTAFLAGSTLAIQRNTAFEVQEGNLLGAALPFLEEVWEIVGEAFLDIMDRMGLEYSESEGHFRDPDIDYHYVNIGSMIWEFQDGSDH